MGTLTSFPASTTSTVYLLWAFRRGLTGTDAYAIAADYITPGTPSVTVGSYTVYSYDERAYEFAANATTSTLNATLDLSPANVTVRYKPVVKVANWTGGAPILAWGGSALAAGSDYRYYNDTATSTLYLQLYFDVVTTGAVLGQRNNAALLVQPSVVSASVTFTGDGSLSASGVQVVSASTTFSGHGALAVSGVQVLSGAVTFPGHGLLSVSVGTTVSASVTFSGHGQMSAGPGVQVLTGAATFAGHGQMSAGPVVQVLSASAAFSGQGGMRVGPGLLALYAAVAFSGRGLLTVALAAPPVPAGVSVTTGGAGNGPTGASAALVGGASGASAALAGVVSGVSITAG